MEALPARLLAMEAFLMLLVVPAVAKSGHGPLALRTALVGGLFVLLLVAAGLWQRRRRTATGLGTAIQIALIACGLSTWPMYVVGVLFAALWFVAVRYSRQGARG